MILLAVVSLPFIVQQVVEWFFHFFRDLWHGMGRRREILLHQEQLRLHQATGLLNAYSGLGLRWMLLSKLQCQDQQPPSTG